ncbi:hypothetical protein TWF718_005602 [Orbilia javanica]|uniref:Uncharacterized protein n=1 Tax=Orbilia javanica TaxID=47235 RepID=A0AAN8N1T1_9PEZI
MPVARIRNRYLHFASEQLDGPDGSAAWTTGENGAAWFQKGESTIDIIIRSPMSIGPHHMTTDMYGTGADGYVLQSIDVRAHMWGLLNSSLMAGWGLHISIGFDNVRDWSMWTDATVLFWGG